MQLSALQFLGLQLCGRFSRFQQSLGLQLCALQFPGLQLCGAFWGFRCLTRGGLGHAGVVPQTGGGLEHVSVVPQTEGELGNNLG